MDEDGFKFNVARTTGLTVVRTSDPHRFWIIVALLGLPEAKLFLYVGLYNPRHVNNKLREEEILLSQVNNVGEVSKDILI